MTYLSSSAECVNCGSQHRGKPFCTYTNGVHCFSCGYTKSYDRSFTTRDIQGDTPRYPDIPNCNWEPSKFSIINLKWLSKYYVDDKIIRQFRIGETTNNGLVFPYIIGGSVVCYQTRWNVEPRLIVSRGAKVPAVFAVCESRTLVLVEDFISAIRVAEHCHSVCLWGTKAQYKDLQEWFNKYDNILVWLDNDSTKRTNSGQEAAKKICKTLNDVLSYNKRRYGFGLDREVTFSNIVTEHDPKMYSPSEIREIIGANHAIPAKQ